MRVAIIGAGLTGLTTAFYLRKRGVDVTVFERLGRAGGVINTIRAGDFIYENGPSTGVLSSPETAELFEELKGRCALEIAREEAKYRWIWKKERWHALPAGLPGGITTSLFTVYDKLRLLGEPFRKRGADPGETLKELVLRRMGTSFLDYAVDPFVLGIYAGDPAKLVTRYAFPKLYALEQKYGSFIGGTVKKAREPKTPRDGKATRELFSVKGGLSNMIDALVEKTGRERIILNATNVTVCPMDRGYELTYGYGCRAMFDIVISTAGAHALRDIFGFLPAEMSADIERLEYARIVQVSAGFKKWTGITLKAFGGLVPFCENRGILGAQFLSSFLTDRAPEGGAMLTSFLGGVRKPNIIELPDNDIENMVASELKTMLGLTKWCPDLFVINRYRHAIPQYGKESENRLKAIGELEKAFPGLILAGGIRDGIGMADRIKQGRLIAEGVSH